MSQDTTQDGETATVEEENFSGSARYFVEAPDKRVAKAAAKQFWKDEHGSEPSTIVAEEVPLGFHGDDNFRVIVTDESSGSHATDRTITFDN